MRNKKIDLLRVCAIFLIVWLHSATDKVFSGVFMQISAVPVHIFFLLAGYFCFGKSDKQLWKRILYIAYLYILASLFYFFICCVVTKSSPISYLKELYSIGLKKFILCFFVFNIFLPGQLGGHLWYLSAFIVAMVALVAVKRKFLLTISVVLYFVGTVISRIIFPIKDISVSAYCFRNGIFEAIPMVFLGYYLHSVKNKTTKIYSNKKLFFCISVLILVISYTILTVVYKKFSICTDLALCNVIIAVTLFYLFSYPSEEKKDNPILSFFAFIGARLTLYIYLIHPLFIYLFKKILSGFAVTWLAFLSSLIVSYLYYELKKTFYEIINKKSAKNKTQENLTDEELKEKDITK